MNPPPPPTPLLDATCDRIVAALTQRLARAAQQLDAPAPEITIAPETQPATQHDFLVPMMHPELAEPTDRDGRPR